MSRRRGSARESSRASWSGPQQVSTATTAGSTPRLRFARRRAALRRLQRLHDPVPRNDVHVTRPCRRLPECDDGLGGPSGWTTLHRSPVGDPRASSQNDLQAEFLGDYVYADATNSYGVGVWNDVRAGSATRSTRGGWISEPKKTPATRRIRSRIVRRASATRTSGRTRPAE